MEALDSSDLQCWLCESSACTLASKGVQPSDLSPDNFAITDAHYGRVLSIFRCGDCGFLFCPDAGDVTHFYAQLEDTEYERTRDQRAMQAGKLLDQLPRKAPCSLLDIGAGSGILVEQALVRGFKATGVEPSTWLVQQAAKRALPVTEGLFPQADPAPNHDVITVIDVLEHVHDPLQLLRDVRKKLAPGGIAVIVTPDVKSLPARLLGARWWHYRIAHIGYFHRGTLAMALGKAGLRPVSWSRPAWFFPLDYLFLRLGQYLPGFARLASLGVGKRITIPLNLRDSWTVVAQAE